MPTTEPTMTEKADTKPASPEKGDVLLRQPVGTAPLHIRVPDGEGFRSVIVPGRDEPGGALGVSVSASDLAEMRKRKAVAALLENQSILVTAAA